MPTINPFGKDIVRVETEFCGRKLELETGRLAFQADGAVLVRYGDTVILGVAQLGPAPEHLDYFPLMVDYEERMYAAGKLSGSRFIKREGRPSDDAVLTSRLIDRPIRPLFPKGYKEEVQLITMALSLDKEVRPDIVAMIAASAALSMTSAPFEGPLAGVRIGLINDKLVAYPNTSVLKDSKLDLVVAGTENAIMMVEAGANEVDEATMVEALELAQQSIQPAVKLQNELLKKLGIVKTPFEVTETDDSVAKQVDKFLGDKLKSTHSKSQLDRRDKREAIKQEMLKTLVTDSEADESPYLEAFDAADKREIRRSILEDGVRPDLRAPDEIRELSSEVGVLPSVHGSSIFTRGSTQALNITTLAPLSYAMVIDTMEKDEEKTYIHHYNFPGYSTGEVSRPRGPGRREIGHGALAERAIIPVLPGVEEFPYTIRVVSELMSSNGSTSMAAVCSSTLSLMDAGVPLKRPVSGIAMGLMMDGANGKHVVLSDIAGAEDFAGDMDFKVAGTSQGITALQMDIKVHGLTTDILKSALEQARVGRAHILDSMLKTIPEPRSSISPNAPRVETIQINVDKVRDVIGKGGETINKIIDETGVEIDIRDGGLVMITAVSEEAIEKAKQWIKDLTVEPEVGKIYDGEVVKVMEFGAFVQIMPGKDGLVHVSQMSHDHVKDPNDVVKEGDKVRVKLVAIDERGRLNLTMKDVE